MKKVSFSLCIVSVLTFTQCERFLAEKSDRALVIPSTLRDAQSLLDNYSIINGSDAGEGEVASDDYYLSDDTWAGLRNEEDRRAYIWHPEYSIQYNRWSLAYRNIYYANIILESLAGMNVTPEEQGEWRNVRGQALFLRARSFLNVAVIWSLAFDDENADQELGIPLRLSSDYNVVSTRSTIRETYRQIVDDLTEAVVLLPDNSEVSFRAAKVSANALLARVYLFMGEYERCFEHADASLRLNDYLLDFNNVDGELVFPFSDYENNKEIAYFSYMSSRPQLNMNASLIDSNLVSSFSENDLRRKLFFRQNQDGSHSFRGSYGGSILFSGIARDEIFLMRAECLARRGEVYAAMQDLNRLLEKRYAQGAFVPYKAERADDVLKLILEERRKEMIFRGIRFPDVKRLNKGGAAIQFKRLLDGTEYVLLPNELRFALPIPEAVIERAPGIIQNPQ